MSAREVLQSWKEISAYLSRDIRTCRRWYVLTALTSVLVIGALGWRAISNDHPRFVPTGDRPVLAVLPKS